MQSKWLYKWMITLTFLTVSLTNAYSQQPAFPGAEGCGKFVTGGRGTPSVPTTIFEVTKLSDDGSVGTLRYALNATATYRTIIFRVSGTIYLTSALKITKPNTTIAGQTASGDGICLADYPVSISADNVIVRYIRFRMGDKNQLKTTPSNCGVPVAPFTAACMPLDGSGGDDAFGGTYRKNIIIDHCTMSWSNDEACTFYGGDSMTLQWNVISEPLNYSYHFETGDIDFERHGYGGIWGGKNVTFHHNLLAHCQGRVPRFDGSRNLGNGSTPGLENADFRNNVLYNWGGYNTNAGEGGNYNIVNNYYKYGPSTSTGSTSGVSIRFMILNPYKQSSPVLPYGKFYVTGNYIDGSTANTARNWLAVAMSGGSYADTVTSKVNAPFPLLPIPDESALEAYQKVLASAGASLPKRDTLDQRIINNVINRTGRIIDAQGGYPHGVAYALTTGAWPTLNVLTAPVDTDKDGMPDSWEVARGLNPSNAADRNIIHTNGYTHLENYLNGDSIIAAGIANTCIATKTITATNNGGWLQFSDTTSSILISTDTLNLFASVADNGGNVSYSSSYYVSGTTRFFNGFPYLNRNVTITPSTAVTMPVKVRLYFTANEFNALKAAEPSITSVADLKVLLVNNNACATVITAPFTAITSVANGSFGTYQAGYYIEFTTTNFGTFFIGANIATLPLKLVSFKGNVVAREVQLNWITSSEAHVQNFMIERSADNVNFQVIGTVAAANANALQEYRFVDVHPLSNTSYYRLKINENNGTSFFSYTIAIVNNIGTGGIQISPNPIIATATISHPATVAGSFSIVSSDGRLVYTQNVSMANGTQTQLNLQQLPPATYCLIFNNAEGEKKYTRFVKQ